MPTVPGLSKQVYLDLDLTGSNPNNLIQNELHIVPAHSVYPIKPLYGKFYKETILVYALLATGALQKLTFGTDFVCVEGDPNKSSLSGLDVYKAINILTTAHAGTYYLTYQAVGGIDSPDYAMVTRAVEDKLLQQVAVNYSDVKNKPLTFHPSTHQHDVVDLYGFEYLVESIEDFKSTSTALGSTFLTTPVAYKDYAVFNAVNKFITNITTAGSSMVANISAHINNTGLQHNYTAAMIGLGNVANYSFTPSNDANGNPVPYYASPAFVGNAIFNKPAKVTYPHATQTNNPHYNTSTSVGLGNVQNYALWLGYNFGQQLYQSLLLSPSNIYYLSNYTLKSAVTEYFDVSVMQPLAVSSTNLTNSNTGVIATLAAQVNNSNTIAQNALTAVNDIVNAADQVPATLATVNNENRRFQLIDYNRPLAVGLQRILAFDYAKSTTGYSVGLNGFWPLPQSLDNLYLWLDADYAGNTIRVDSNGNQRITSFADRSSFQRLFVSNTTDIAPFYGPSQDVSDGRMGVTNGKVAKFMPGHYMEQISGSPLTLSPGMTVFVVVRTGSTHVPFSLLSDPSPSQKVSITLQSDANKIISIDTTYGWTPLQCADNTSVPNTSNLIVASIADDAEGYSWLGSCVSIDPTYPRGVNTPVSMWPDTSFQTAAMSRIGNPDIGANESAEISDVIVFNRQLSFAECEAVIAYLRLVKSKNQALTVDLSAQSVFNI